MILERTIRMNAHTITTNTTRNAKPAPVTTIAEADAEHASYLTRRQPILDQLEMLVNDRSERVSPELVAITKAHHAAYVKRDLLREVPAGNPGHDEWDAEVARLDHIETEALLALFAYEARRTEDFAYRAKYLLVIDKSSDVFATYGAGEALLQSMANAVNPFTSAMQSETYPETSESRDPEVRMSWLMRAYRDAAMLIDPTIRGCWICNNVNFTPVGGTTLASVFFDRGEGAGFKRRPGEAQIRQSYLASERLEPLDLSAMSLRHLIGLSRSIDDYGRAVNVFLSADAFHTHDEDGRATGSTWNGEMIETLRAWCEEESERIIEAIRAYEPEDAYWAYQKAMFLIWWQAEIGGELHDLLKLAAEGAVGQVQFGKEAGSAAADVMVEFIQLDEAGQEALLATARDMVAQKKAA
jgi:hypothetical protein